MAVLTYNGVSLPYCHVQRCSLDAVQDDTSTDKLVTKFDIMAQSIITPDMLDMVAPDFYATTTSTAQVMALIQENLLKPRKKLSFQFDSIEFIPQPAGVRGFVDACNGPFPQTCELVQMDENAWLISYHVIANYVVNYEATTPSGALRLTNSIGNVVLSNKWEERVDMDQSMYSTRTRMGRCIIRSDNDAGLLADEVRSQMCVVSVPAGFLRKRSDYKVSPDGLRLAYTTVDYEVFRLPPAPAYEAEGDFYEQSSRFDGKRILQCRVALRAAKSVPQSKLASTAVGMVMNRLNQAGQPIGDNNVFGVVLLGAGIRYKLFDNSVECWAQTFKPTTNQPLLRGKGLLPGQQTTAFQAIDNPSFGRGPPLQQPRYFDRGSAGLLLRAASYWDPNLVFANMGPAVEYATSNPQTPVAGARNQLRSPGNLLREPGNAGLNPPPE